MVSLVPAEAATNVTWVFEAVKLREEPASNVVKTPSVHVPAPTVAKVDANPP